MIVDPGFLNRYNIDLLDSWALEEKVYNIIHFLNVVL